MRARRWLMGSLFFSLLATGEPAKSAGKKLAAEPLERRDLLAATGLVEVGEQPSGALDDKIVYVHGGHGITATGSGWGYQRPLLLDMVEDLGNQDQMTIFADQLWNAGATVVPLRPVGNQVNEAVLDNDDLGVSFDGPWGNGSGAIYYGDPGDVRYKFATTSLTETAVATYRPTLPEGGFYPVYAWSPAGSNRAVDQLYRVHHTGGATEVRVDHSRVGNGLVYLGTYHFDSGDSGYVEISNQSNDPGKVVVADMIRFGNGMGDINRGNGVSGQPRENEAALYWLEWHAVRSEGVPTSAYRSSSSDSTATVSSPTRYATFMNQSGVGAFSDRVFVSYHSNATTGNPATATARGVIALHNTPNGGATPNQLDLAFQLAQEINQDLVAQNGQFEHNWQSRSSLTFAASFNYGEINNSTIGNEFDATIVETGFHDNTLDAQMLRDPRVRDALARATTQGLVDYFRITLGDSISDTDVPSRVAELSAEVNAPEQVTLSWTPGAVSSAVGGSPAGYMIYASTDGYGFDGGTYVDGGATTTHTLTGLAAGETYYFRVAAVNDGGQGAFSEVVAAKPSASPEKVLIVNGFDRLERSLVPGEPFPSGGEADRVRPRMANSYDYAVQIATAINAASATPVIATAANEAIADGSIDLSDYDAVFWISGEESSADDTFNGAEQAAVAAYLGAGGKLFVSGAEIGWDLDNLNNGRSFYNNTLRANYVADDAGTYSATGVVGSIFEDLSLQFDDGEVFYDVDFPDVIAPFAGSTAALDYGNGAGAAAVQYTGGGAGEQLVMLAFPFETIVSESGRTEAMRRVLDYFGFATIPVNTTSVILDDDDGAPTFTEVGVWTIDADPGADGGLQRFALRGQAATATWQTDLAASGDVEVFVKYDAAPNHVTGAAYTVDVGGQSSTVFVNQQQNDFVWVSLGTFAGSAGPISVTLDAATSSGGGISFVVADQVRIDLNAPAFTATGDFNGDGVVDAADYTVWRDTLGTIVTPRSGADADGSGLVDAADRQIWLDTFGQTVATAFATATAPISTASSIDPPASVVDEPVGIVDQTVVLSRPTRSIALRPSFAPAGRASGLGDRAEAADRALLLLASDPSSTPSSAPTTLEQPAGRSDAAAADSDEAFETIGRRLRSPFAR